MERNRGVMMDHYIDIRVKPVLELSINILLSEIFCAIHKALYSEASGKIGVSFPEYKKTLGAVIRLHGDYQSLKNLINRDELLVKRSYFDATEITPVPSNAKHRTVSRFRVKSSASRIFRRFVRKGWLSQEEAESRLENMKPERCSLPYLQVKSQSTCQKYPLFVEHGDIVDKPVVGTYSNYGLSKVATVPWF